MQHVHILSWPQQNGLHSLTLSWGLMSEGRLHESDNKICWYLMHLSIQTPGPPIHFVHCSRDLSRLLSRQWFIVLQSNTWKYGDDDKKSQAHNTHLLILCCFCSWLASETVNLYRRNLLVGQLLAGAADTNNWCHYTHSVMIHDTFWPQQKVLHKMSQPGTELKSFTIQWFMNMIQPLVTFLHSLQ